MSNYIGNQPAFGEFKKLDSIVSLFNGSTTQFNLEHNSVGHTIGDATQLIVSLNGVIQEPGTAYTFGLGGGSIVFASAPASTDTCHIVSLGGVGGTTTPTDGSVTASKLDPNLKDYLEETFTADGTQTVFTLTRAAIGSNSLLLSVDGIVQPSTAYSVAGTTLTISPALPNTTNVRVVHLGVQSGVYIPAADSITSNQLATLNGNLNFDDNAKAVFGEGSDLQIYHDGSDSYIFDAGTGILRLKSNGSKILMETASGETLAEFINNGNAVLYSNNVERVRTNGTGIDVTGTVAANGFIGQVTNLDIKQNTSDGADNKRTRIGGGGDVINTRGAFIELHGNEHASTGKAIINAGNVTGGEISLRTGGTERMVIDSVGEVGIGTSNPLAKLQIKTQANGNAAFQNSTSVAGGVKINAFNDAGSASVPFEIDGSSLQFNIASVEKMRIDASGNLLVGMTTDNITSTGIGLVKDGVSHMYSAVSGANATLMLGRGGSDGNVLSFNRSGTTFGNIGGGTSTGELVISTNSGIGYISQKLTGDTDGIQYSNVGTYHVGPWISKNNTIDLGRSNSGWRDLYLTGGIQFDAQSNKLDDYEEGLHTFTLKGANSGSATIPIRSGYTKLAYTKIGRMVTITGKIETLGSHSTSGALRLSLPFTAANLSDQAGVAGGSCFIYRTSQSIYDNPAILPSSTAPYAIFYYNTTSGDVAAINANNLDAAFEILVNFSYFTT